MFCPWRREMATHSSILAWEIQWTEEPGGLESMGLQRVRHDWVAKQLDDLNESFMFGAKIVSELIDPKPDQKSDM